MLSQGSYGLYPAGNVMFRVNPLMPGGHKKVAHTETKFKFTFLLPTGIKGLIIVRLELCSNLLVPHVFACKILVYLFNHVILY